LEQEKIQDNSESESEANNADGGVGGESEGEEAKTKGGTGSPPRDSVARGAGAGGGQSDSEGAEKEDVVENAKDGDGSGSEEKGGKRFAWMDSDDEGCAEASSDVGPRAAKARKERSPSPASPSSPDVLMPGSLSEVRSFAQMCRLAGGLKATVKSMQPSELVECLAAVVRVNYYDPELLREMLIPRIQRQLAASRGASMPFTTDALVTVLVSLTDLNNFHQGIFDAVAKEIAKRGSKEVDPMQRGRILSTFRKAKYDCAVAKDFYEQMKVAEGSERYAEACVQQRMICGNSNRPEGMRAPEGYLRTMICGMNNDGTEVERNVARTSLSSMCQTSTWR
jgi:hypothetical protein